MPKVVMSPESSKVRVRLDVRLSGWATVDISKSDFEELLRREQERGPIPLEAIDSFDYDDMMNQLNGEIDDFEILPVENRRGARKG